MHANIAKNYITDSTSPAAQRSLIQVEAAFQAGPPRQLTPKQADDLQAWGAKHSADIRAEKGLEAEKYQEHTKG